MQYKIGDTVTYQTFRGKRATVVVTGKEDNIKDGYPGFDGVTADGDEVWGYDDQIIMSVSPRRSNQVSSKRGGTK